MKPINTSNTKITNCTPISSNCVVWEGSLPTCIEACYGDTVVDIIYKVADKVCTLENSVEFLTADMGCLPITDFDGTVSSAIKILIEEHCLLSDRVSELENAPSSGGSTTPTHLSFGGTNYLCVANIVGSTLNSDATDNQIIDFIFKGLCTVGTTLTSEISRLESLIGTGSGTGTPSSVMVTSGCLFSGSKSIGQAWSYIDTHYCAFTAKFGTVAEVSSAIVEESVWLSDINTQLLTPLALDTISGSTTEAQMIKNLWHVVGALNDKLTSTALALSACCGFSCKKFEVTVNAINFDAAANTVDLRFGFDGSSNLPGAPYTFVDTGSSVIFTDSTGFSLASIPVDITGTLIPYTDYDITGLDFSGEIQVDVDLQFQVLDETDPLNIREFNCTKCLHTFFKSNVGCAFCHLIIGGTDLDVKITFTSGGTTQTMNITSAGTYVLPSASTIDDILIISGSMFTIASESCPTLVFPEYSIPSCYSFVIDQDFFNSTVGTGFAWYYDIVGFMENGTDIVTYSNPIRCDLTNRRDNDSYTNVTTEVCTDDTFVEIPVGVEGTFLDSFNKLDAVNTNSTILGASKICNKADGSGGLQYTNVIMRAVTGKNIFMHLVPVDDNNTVSGLVPKPDVYIKGVEIPQGEDCDCCYVYDAS